MAEKIDLASAGRRLRCSNKKTRRRALKLIKEFKRSQVKQAIK